MVQQPGFTQALFMYAESSFGVKPGIPTYVHLPVLNYGLKFRPEVRKSDPFTGLLAKKHMTKFRGLVSGQMVVPTYGWVKSTKSILQHIWDWAFDASNPDALYLPSMGFEWAQDEIDASVNHSGVRVNSVTIAGDENSGTILTTLDCIGQAEANQATVQALPDDMEKLVEAEFADVVFKIDTYAGGTPAAFTIGSFSLTQQNGIKPHYLNSFTPTLLPRSLRDITLSISGLKEDDAYDILNRTQGGSEFVAQLVIKALHNGTGAGGNNTVCTIDLPRLSLEPVADDQGGRQDLITQPLNFTALKDDTTDDIITFTYDDDGA